MKHVVRMLVISLIPFLSGCGNKLFKIPSGSMEATLPVNSGILVTETEKYERNNIIVYMQYGHDYSIPQPPDGPFEKKWQYRVSRIIGMSGDTLQIKGGDMLINGKELPHVPKALLLYEIYSSAPIDDFQEKTSRIFQEIPSENGHKYHICLTLDEARKYSTRNPAILSIKRILRETGAPDSMYVRDCGTVPVSIDQIGPIYIPRPGDTVIIKDCNRILFANIPGMQAGINVIKEKLYFMISDNWYGAEDSRFTGFVAESKLFGIVKE